MDNEISKARARVAALKSDLASAEYKLSNLVASCRHEFGAVVSDPIVRKGYTEPGDVPGTMGIDYRSSFYVPEQRTPRWTRTCLNCGKVEETREVVKTVVQSPNFR